MTVDEQRFFEELEVFRGGAEEASQFLYAYLTVARRARESRRVLRHLRENSTFWVTVQAALQRSCLIALGRLFDQNSQHNLDRLLGLATRGRALIFSRAALRERKRAVLDPSRLAEYMGEAYEPTAGDFRDIRRRVARLRRVYNASYRDIRDTFAHVGATQPQEIAQIYARTRTAELQRLVVDLLTLRQVLWALFMDGRRPTWRRPRYSARPVRGMDAWKSVTTDPPHERIVHQAECVLAQASRRSSRRT
jgi:hypothetical protein